MANTCHDRGRVRRPTAVRSARGQRGAGTRVSLGITERVSSSGCVTADDGSTRFPRMPGKEAELQRLRGDLDPASGAELALDVGHVNGGRLLADEEGFSDLAIGLPRCDQQKDLELSRTHGRPAASDPAASASPSSEVLDRPAERLGSKLDRDRVGPRQAVPSTTSIPMPRKRGLTLPHQCVCPPVRHVEVVPRRGRCGPESGSDAPSPRRHSAVQIARHACA